jgi:hypothetical protein
MNLILQLYRVNLHDLFFSAFMYLCVCLVRKNASHLLYREIAHFNRACKLTLKIVATVCKSEES